MTTPAAPRFELIAGFTNERAHAVPWGADSRPVLGSGMCVALVASRRGPGAVDGRAHGPAFASGRARGQSHDERQQTPRRHAPTSSPAHHLNGSGEFLRRKVPTPDGRPCRRGTFAVRERYGGLGEYLRPPVEQRPAPATAGAVSQNLTGSIPKSIQPIGCQPEG